MRKIANAAASLCVASAVGLAMTPGDAQAQAGAVELGTKHEANVHYPQMSPDGSQIAYEVNYPAEKRTEVWLVGHEGGRLTGSPVRVEPESMNRDLLYRYGRGKNITHMFGWAPGGSKRKYAYTVNNAEGHQQIYIDGWSGFISDGVSKEPRWDPLSPRFVFTSNRTGNGDLYMWDDGAEMQLTFDELHAEIYPSWAPAGDKVAFVRAGKGESQVMVLDVNAYSSVPLVNFSGKDSTRPSFSPRGDKVAFLSNKSTDSVMKFGLWVVDATPGSSPRNIGPNIRVPSKGAPSWTPDGRGVIAVIDDREKRDPIAIFPIDGGPPRILKTGTVNNRDPRLVVVDGQWRVVFTSQGAESQGAKSWYGLFVYDVPH